MRQGARRHRPLNQHLLAIHEARPTGPRIDVCAGTSRVKSVVADPMRREPPYRKQDVAVPQRFDDVVKLPIGPGRSKTDRDSSGRRAAARAPRSWRLRLVVHRRLIGSQPAELPGRARATTVLSNRRIRRFTSLRFWPGAAVASGVRPSAVRRPQDACRCAPAAGALLQIRRSVDPLRLRFRHSRRRGRGTHTRHSGNARRRRGDQQRAFALGPSPCQVVAPTARISISPAGNARVTIYCIDERPAKGPRCRSARTPVVAALDQIGGRLKPRRFPRGHSLLRPRARREPGTHQRLAR